MKHESDPSCRRWPCDSFRQEISTGYGYASGQPAICHFGFVDRLRVNVTVRLPNGMMISRSGVAVNQTLILEELGRE